MPENGGGTGKGQGRGEYIQGGTRLQPRLNENRHRAKALGQTGRQAYEEAPASAEWVNDADISVIAFRD